MKKGGNFFRQPKLSPVRGLINIPVFFIFFSSKLNNDCTDQILEDGFSQYQYNEPGDPGKDKRTQYQSCYCPN